jgi:hypothetical protein
MDRQRLLGFERLANDSFSTTTAGGMKLFLNTIDGFHVKGILLRILKDEGGIPNWKIIGENGHGPKIIILEIV